ncbi:MAG: hypothetical protein ACR2Q4_21140 [Geminicoccaceae bacterium]
MKLALERAGLELDQRLIWQGKNVRGFGDTERSELGRTAVRELLGQDFRA